jgi:hypothetical protein
MTGLIRDGQRIRVHGSDGYVEILLKAIAGVGDHNSRRRLAHLERRSTVVQRQVGAACPVFP